MFNAFISCVSKAAHDVGKDQEIVTANNCTLVHASPLPMYSCTKQLNTSQNVPRPRMRTVLEERVTRGHGVRKKRATGEYSRVVVVGKGTVQIKKGG